jgi:hypothetical protein
MPSKESLSVVDPVLTNFSLAYWQQRDVTDTGSGFGMTGKFIAPPITTGGNQTFRYFTYNLRNRFQRPDSLRAAKTEYKKVEWDVSSATDEVEDRGYLSDWDDNEVSTQIRPVDLNQDSTEVATDALLLDYDARVNTLVTTAGNYTNTSTAAALTGGTGIAWDTAGSDPIKDMLAMQNTIYKASGILANRCVVGWEVWVNGLARNDEVIAALQAANMFAGIDDVTPIQVGKLLGIDLRVNTTLAESSKEGQATVTTALDFGKNAVVYFNNPAVRVKSRTFARTFEKRGLQVETGRVKENKRNWVATSHEVKAKMIAELTGYLLTTVVS